MKGENGMDKVKEYLKIIDEVIEKGPFKDNWQSLSNFKIPSWYREKRLGIFIHWGVFSVPACESEWYPRLMYQQGTASNTSHAKKYGMDFEYRHMVAKFKPEKFDAKEWIGIFKNSGAKYIMPVGEHHDGIKLYESKLNKWNMMDLNGRDYIKELHQACDEGDMGFLMSNHRAEHFWFFNGARKYYPESEISKNLYPDLYGPAYLPKSGNMHKTDQEITATKEYLEDWLTSACEMIDRNQPLGVYFDWWVQKNEFRPYMKKFLAYYYNRGIEWGKEVCVFYKWGAIFDGCAVFDVERGQIDGVARELWQNDTSIAQNSWGYTENNKFKSSADIIRNLIEVVSKNGCYMLNVGPKADGTICDEEKKVLAEIGRWLSVNGEAIYGSNPFEVCPFEGKKSKNGAFQENKKFSSKDFCFTARPGKIYVFPMGNKLKKKIRIKCLRRANEGGIRYQIHSVHLLGDTKELNYTQNEAYFEIDFGTTRNLDTPFCICLEVD